MSSKKSLRILSVTDNSWADPSLRVIVTQLADEIPLNKGGKKAEQPSLFCLQGVVLTDCSKRILGKTKPGAARRPLL
jgi:hypothetical protein